MKAPKYEQPQIKKYNEESLERDREAYRKERVEHYRKLALRSSDEKDRGLYQNRALEYEQMNELKLRREFLNNLPAKLPGGAERGSLQVLKNIKSEI